MALLNTKTGFTKFNFANAKLKWTKRLERDVERLLKQGVREWLRSMLVGVPIWSGMAMGSIKLAEGSGGSLARFLNVAMPINPIGPSSGSFTSPVSGKKVHLDKYKTPEAGGLLSSYKFVTKGHRFSFKFSSETAHLVYNEFYERTDPGKDGQRIRAPWHAIPKANEALQEFVKNEIKEDRFSRLLGFLVADAIDHNTDEGFEGGE